MSGRFVRRLPSVEVFLKDWFYWGHEKHLLNIQYRTHPSISIFPNVKFYGGQIMDLKMLRPQVMKGVILKERCVDPYSFIYVCNNENEGVDAKLSKKTWQR